MSEAKIKVRIIHPPLNAREGERNTHNFKRGSSISISPEQCASCKEQRRGHEGGEEFRSAKQGNEKTRALKQDLNAPVKSYQKELAVLYVSDIARSIRESLRLRKTLRV